MSNWQGGMAITLTLAIGVVIISAAPAHAGDDRVCAIAMYEGKDIAEAAPEAREYCKADDVLHLVETAPSRPWYPANMIEVLCRFDRQILFIPNPVPTNHPSYEVSCVYRGEPRAVYNKDDTEHPAARY